LNSSPFEEGFNHHTFITKPDIITKPAITKPAITTPVITTPVITKPAIRKCCCCWRLALSFDSDGMQGPVDGREIRL